MNSKFLKKKTLLCVMFLGLGLFVPVDYVHAQSIVLPSAFKGNATVGQDLQITAVTSPIQGGVTIKFAAIDRAVSFSPTQCITEATTGVCTVNFKSTKDGSFFISLSSDDGHTPLGRQINVFQTANNPQGETGDCTVNTSTSSTNFNGYSQSACEALRKTTSWAPNPGANSLQGTCTVTSPAGANVIPNITSIDCAKYKVTTFWAKGSITQPTPVPTDTTVICKYAEKGEIDPAKALNPPCINPQTAVYDLLAPLPGQDGRPISSINVRGNNALGTYINTIIRLVIGLSAVLAVLMIVRGGIEYITSELPGVKGEGKSRITNAIVGLLIALSSWLILNTINPKILETNINIADVKIEYDPEQEIVPSAGIFDSSAPATTGIVNNCKEGIINVSTQGGTFVVCKSIESNVRSMINMAHSQGYRISGWGWRSAEKQKQLRRNHCGPSDNDIYNKPSSSCRPPTARPGKSQHESGLALDLTCDGVSIQTRDNRCFLWLQTNARNFGMNNLPSEPWHWSTTGR